MIFLNMKFIKFHGIPWNFKKVPWNSMELFGRELKVPCNSMELGRMEKNPWNFGSGQNSMELFGGKLKVPWNSMELGRMEKVTWNSMELWTWSKFHGIPWNLRFCFSSSMRCCSNVVQRVPWNFLIKMSFNEHWKEILNDILIRNE